MNLLLSQSSLSALHASIESQDWEAAALNCSRAMALPLDLISGPFAGQTVVSNSILNIVCT